MRYGSVCSGIEAATAAWHPLGWRPVFFSEIEKFPSRVLAHHYPDTPNLGDFTRYTRSENGEAIPELPYAIDLLVGGTPCQSFSVSGLRGGMADARGGLALEFLKLAQRTRPRWIVWENVPGVLSIDDGRAFGSFLGGLAELGYGWAYRILDAQFFGVAQRRNRVFVVGSARGWASAAAVLFERASLRGDPPPSRAARDDVASTIGCGSGARGWCDDFERSGGFIPEVARTCLAKGNDSHAADLETYVSVGRTPAPFIANAEGSEEIGLTASCGAKGVNNQTPLVAFDLAQITSAANRSKDPAPTDPAPTLAKGSRMHVASSFPWTRGDDPTSTMELNHEHTGTLTTSHTPAAALIEPIAFHMTQDPIHGPVSPAVGSADPSTGVLTPRGLVRRLTPREYERLFGFPDDYTLIDPSVKDGPRYRALGNTMAVPVMRWIGRRIARVDELLKAAGR